MNDNAFKEYLKSNPFSFTIDLEYDNQHIYYKDGILMWLENGINHRDDDDRPAYFNLITDELRWYRNGLLDRPDQIYRVNMEFEDPTIIRKDRVCWYQNGVLHNDTGPSIIDNKGITICRNGVRIIRFDPKNFVITWWINGEKVNRKFDSLEDYSQSSEVKKVLEEYDYNNEYTRYWEEFHPEIPMTTYIYYINDWYKDTHKFYLDAREDAKEIVLNYLHKNHCKVSIESYIGETKFDKKNGKGKMMYDNGDIYEGEWENDEIVKL